MTDPLTLAELRELEGFLTQEYRWLPGPNKILRAVRELIALREGGTRCSVNEVEIWIKRYRSLQKELSALRKAGKNFLGWHLGEDAPTNSIDEFRAALEEGK